MKDVLKAFGIIALVAIMVLVFGMSVVGCDVNNDSVDSALNGTWVYSSGNTVAEYKFSGGNYVFSGNSKPIQLCVLYASGVCRKTP